MFSVTRSLVAALQLLLPSVCLLCSTNTLSGQSKPYFCQSCLDNLSPLKPGSCRRCAQPYQATGADHLCETCLTRPLSFTTVYPAGLYTGSIKSAVHKLKYRDQLILARPLGEILASSLHHRLDKFSPDHIIPVPLHIKRLRARGYNQAHEIARPLADMLAAPLDTKSLRRVRNTPQQQGLNATERRKNLRNAFSLSTPVSGRVLLVDDVMTTGETVRECSRILLDGGAEEVHVAVAGRA